MTLDHDKSGSISMDEFLKIPQLASNPLLARIVRLFDKDGSDSVEFGEFIHALSVFHGGSSQDKLRFVFKIYDIDGDGFISNGELFKVLKMMVGDNLADAQLQQLVDKTIIKADTDGDGKVSFQEFLTVVEDKNVDSKLKIDMSKATK
jgi:serine/threonine-protein phosphatase 2B regulatory subunit